MVTFESAKRHGAVRSCRTIAGSRSGSFDAAREGRGQVQRALRTSAAPPRVQRLCEECEQEDVVSRQTNPDVPSHSGEMADVVDQIRRDREARYAELDRRYREGLQKTAGLPMGVPTLLAVLSSR